MKEIIKIEDRAELIGFLRGIGTECRFVTLDTETVMDMRKFEDTGRKVLSPKTGKLINEKIPNPYLGTVKVAKRNGLVGVDFVKACERRYAELNGLSVKDVEYTPGDVWYVHCMTQDGKPLALCEGKKPSKRTGKIEKYLQYFPLRNLGETAYIHPTIGRLTAEQVKDMYKRFVADDEREEWKPNVITLGIDSIRSITFRKIKLLNETTSRLMGRMTAWKKTRANTARPAPVVAEDPDDRHPYDLDGQEHF